MAVPSLRDDARNVSWWLAVGFVAGALGGGLVGGFGGRLAMLVLRLTSDADGLISDDGFTIGQFTLSDTLQLYAATAFLGAINGVAYVAIRALLPRGGRIAVWGLVGATVVGGLVVNTDGVDFTLLEPRWLAIVAFVALPGLAALLVAWLVERSARIEPWGGSRWLGLLIVPASPALLAAPAFLVGAVAFLGLGRIDWVRRLHGRHVTRVIAIGVLTAAIVAGGVDVTRDAFELL